ncbi:subtilisin inhibitor [Gilbertella persicaria]|uniref:subtilisin inhibitor n=1 Tax=Gilbertella persicaria TaxID=101096 RepID=UPI00221F2433|nr:subtilisin inhibitor [Gilbertella persicaria]KAI8084007.1 subtilisin inhibitor [Gilbertella persicaria]
MVSAIKFGFLMFASMVLAYPSSPSRSLLLIQVEPQNGSSTVTSLTCNPLGGSHPNPQLACKQLTSVKGLIENIPPEEGIACLAVVDPVTVTIQGNFSGKHIDFTHEYSNACEAGVQLGHLL